MFTVPLLTVDHDHSKAETVAPVSLAKFDTRIIRADKIGGGQVLCHVVIITMSGADKIT